MSEREIFIAALKQPQGSARAGFLEQACGADGELRRQIDGLLQEHEQLGGFLDRPALGLLAKMADQALEKPGTVIGRYKLLEQIGEGGMGLVFMAEQTQPVKRRVALKVLKPGMDTRQVVARFEAERQALALMDHPNIARIHDAGTTESGRPYFVMELVRGVPITEFCDQRRLTTRQRLELFITVCQAVQHAHQKGIIHRDLKPTNVLVTLHDTVAVPKVIDFGIAKATSQSLTERTLFTQFAQMVGTPLYMSPEQAEMNGLDVDTRSDVYSLGVLLYELLTGTTPFESETLKKVGLDEMRRIIRQEEPPTPSRRLSTLAAQVCSTVSERRSVDARRLGHALRGELDWIAMRALEKDRDRRYESASAFAADVQRYLADEAVSACPLSAGYRLRRYVRRNRRALVMAGVMGGVFVAATAVSIWQADRATTAQHQAETERDRARTAEGKAKTNLARAREAEKRATTEASVARAVSNFLQDDLLRQVNGSPQLAEEIARNPHLTVREALDRAAATIGHRFQGQPREEAAIRMTIGEAYASLWLHKLAVPHFDRAVQLRRASLGAGNQDTLISTRALANAYMMAGRHRKAISLLEDTLAHDEQMFGPDHSDTVDDLSSLVEVYLNAGMCDRAIPLAKQVLEKRRARLGPAHPDCIRAMHLVARSYLAAAHFEESIAWHEKVLQATNRSIWPLKTYARALQGAGRLEAADCQLRKALELAQGIRDRRAKEIELATIQTNLGRSLLLQGRYGEAESVSRRTLALLEKELPDDWWRFHVISLVGGALLGQRRYTEAEPFLVQGYQGMKEREAAINAASQHWLTEAGDRLVRHYEATNQPDKAAAWRKKLKVNPK